LDCRLYFTGLHRKNQYFFAVPHNFFVRSGTRMQRKPKRLRREGAPPWRGRRRRIPPAHAPHDSAGVTGSAVPEVRRTKKDEAEASSFLVQELSSN